MKPPLSEAVTALVAFTAFVFVAFLLASNIAWAVDLRRELKSRRADPVGFIFAVIALAIVLKR